MDVSRDRLAALRRVPKGRGTPDGTSEARSVISRCHHLLVLLDYICVIKSRVKSQADGTYAKHGELTKTAWRACDDA